MPTPFSHLAIAQRLLKDEQIPLKYRQMFQEHIGAFLLGSVAADARVGNGAPREVTHFYSYGEEMVMHPWRLMLKLNDELWHPSTTSQWVFVSAYVAHLAMDEYWTLNMVGPHFFSKQWRNRLERFLSLHILLIYMDQRDLDRLETWQADALNSANPDNWLPFIGDDDLKQWQQLIYDQIKPGGISQTCEIFGSRTGVGAEYFEEIVRSDKRIQEELWDYVPKSIFHDIETKMYQFILEQLLDYLKQSQPVMSAR